MRSRITCRWNHRQSHQRSYAGAAWNLHRFAASRPCRRCRHGTTDLLCAVAAQCSTGRREGKWCVRCMATAAWWLGSSPSASNLRDTKDRITLAGKTARAAEVGRLSTALPRMTRSMSSALPDLSRQLRRASMSTIYKPIARDTRPTISSCTCRMLFRSVSNRSDHTWLPSAVSTKRAFTRTLSPSRTMLPSSR